MTSIPSGHGPIRGPNRPNLDADTVRRLLAARAEGVLLADLAARFGVSRTMVQRVLREGK